MVDDKKSIISWSLYDWANSAFATTVMAGFFPLFFAGYWGSNLHETESTFYLGFANSLASLIVAAMAPFLGAVADRMAGKKRFLIFFAFIGIIMTGGLWLVSYGFWQIAILFYIVATIGFSSGNAFYDSLLPGVASKEKADFVSSLGFSIGYIGGGILFLINVIMFLKYEMFGFATDNDAIRFAFLSVALWWLIFSIPVFLFVKEPEVENPPGFKTALNEGWNQLTDTIRDIRHLKYVGLFLLAYWFYIDGVATIIKMAVDYGTKIGFEQDALIIALLITQFVAFPATLIYNWFASKIGVKNGILIAIVAYGIITIFGYFMTVEWQFYALAIVVGCFQGGIQALSRSLYLRIIPLNKSAQFYGFYNMLGKFAAVIGPMLMGTITLITGDIRTGILSIIILFVIGGILLYLVDIEKGEAMAKEYLV